MTWQQRLIELAAASGALAGCANIGGGGGVPCGNANPDPCICGRMPEDSPQCEAERACHDRGGTWSFDVARAEADAGVGLEGACESIADAGVAVPDSRPVPDAAIAD